MTRGDRDAERVRAAIAELREGDALHASAGAPFHAVLRRDRRSPRRVRLHPWRMLAAASLAGLVIFGYRAAAGRAKPLELPREVAALSAWRPMTDVLLETPGRQLLRGGSPLGASILDVNSTGAFR